MLAWKMERVTEPHQNTTSDVSYTATKKIKNTIHYGLLPIWSQSKIQAHTIGPKNTTNNQHVSTGSRIRSITMMEDKGMRNANNESVPNLCITDAMINILAS
jgi:hypothetical protein